MMQSENATQISLHQLLLRVSSHTDLGDLFLIFRVSPLQLIRLPLLSRKQSPFHY